LYWRLIQIEVVQVNNETKKLEKKFSFDHKYPATKIMWLPDNNNNHPDLMVTSGDILKVWNIENNEKAELKCALAGVSRSYPSKKKSSLLL
jgi:WD repeat-containing protein 68